MPYIKKGDGRREVLQKGESALNAGELNFQIFYYIKHNTTIIRYIIMYEQIKVYVDNFLGEEPNYQRYNDMTGCLIRCSKEIKRRLSIDFERMFLSIMNSYDNEIEAYEEIKKTLNGDVE